MAKSGEKTLEKTASDSSPESKYQGQIPCILVYPDRKHVEYVNQIITCLEEMLPTLGFKINKLSDKTPPDKHFGENFEKLAADCIFGIIILDGLRPNVLFEYGFLRGKEKVILPLQDKKACIAIKSLYSIRDLQDESDVKKNTGLTVYQLSKLKEPEIGYFTQLSDRHGMNVVCVDRYAELDSPEHPKQKIRAEIMKLMPEILDRYSRQSLQPIKQAPQKYFTEFQEVTLRILQYYTHATPFRQIHLEKALTEIERLEKDSGFTMPSSTYSTLASSYESLAQQAPPLNTTETIKLLSRALELNEKALKIETDDSECAGLHFRIGDTYLRLSDVRDRQMNSEKAIKAYEEALNTYTKKDCPTDHAMTQNNLGNAYNRLSEVRDKQMNLEKAIKAYEEALTTRTKKDFPIDYAMTQNNLGISYDDLSQVRDKEVNLEKAIKAYEEALTTRTKKDFPIDYATTQNNLGNAYYDLSEVRDKQMNLEKSIKAYEEALNTYTEKDFPIKHAIVKSNLEIAQQSLICSKAKE